MHRSHTAHHLLGAKPTGPCGRPNVRGWDYEPGRVPPSALASPCPTMRSLHLQAMGIRVKTQALRKGAEMHREALAVVESALERGLEGLLASAQQVRTRGGLWALALGYRWIQQGRFPPMSVEPSIGPGGGFGQGKPDIVLGPYPLELVSSTEPRWYWDRKKLVLAAYAMLLEYSLGAPVDTGFLASLSEGVVEEVCIDDKLRVEALKLAALGEEALEADPGLPPECPGHCIYRQVCLGVGDG